MGKQLVGRILATAEKIDWPETATVTPLGRRTYGVVLEKIDEYKGDPKDLAAALRTVLTGQSRPFAFAALAYVLLTAAQEADGTYAPEGVAAAMHWLEQAQALEPDEVDINFIEALVYVHQGRLDDARLVLNYLRDVEPDNYYLHLAEIAYWQAQQDVEKTVYWYEQAIQSSLQVPQKLRLRVREAGFYQQMDMHDKALETYQQAVHFDKANPILWHNMAQIYYQQEKYDEATRCNQRTLQLRDFAAARQLEEAIKKKTSTTGMLGRLFGGGDS